MNIGKAGSWLLLCAAAGGVAGCGSSGTSASSSQKPTKTASASASAPAMSAAQKAVEADWVAFFSAKTPVSRRVALLQDGSTFAPVIKAQAGSSLAKTATAKVTSVTRVSSKQANVVYSILVSGQSALANQKGVAVYQNGTWKVGVASFCSLLGMENGGKTSGLPAACKPTS